MPDKLFKTPARPAWCPRCRERITTGQFCAECCPPMQFRTCRCGKETANAAGVCTECLNRKDGE